MIDKRPPCLIATIVRDWADILDIWATYLFGPTQILEIPDIFNKQPFKKIESIINQYSYGQYAAHTSFREVRSWKFDNNFCISWFSASLESSICEIRLSIPGRPERWSNFQGDGMAMVGFLQRWNGDGFWKFSPSPLMEWYLLNHWQQWFFNGFSNFEDQWFTMVTRFSQKNEIRDKLRVNEDFKNRNALCLKLMRPWELIIRESLFISSQGPVGFIKDPKFHKIGTLGTAAKILTQKARKDYA